MDQFIEDQNSIHKIRSGIRKTEEDVSSNSRVDILINFLEFILDFSGSNVEFTKNEKINLSKIYYSHLNLLKLHYKKSLLDLPNDLEERFPDFLYEEYKTEPVRYFNSFLPKNSKLILANLFSSLKRDREILINFHKEKLNPSKGIISFIIETENDLSFLRISDGSVVELKKKKSVISLLNEFKTDENKVYRTKLEDVFGENKDKISSAINRAKKLLEDVGYEIVSFSENRKTYYKIKKK